MTDMNKMIEKVKKLLALASNNPSEEEAKAAAMKAHKLIAEYNLDMSKETGEKINYKLVEAVHSNNEGYRKPLSVVIAENFRCKAVVIGNIINFFGREGDAEACAETFNYLYRVSHNIGLRMERQARKNGESTHGLANSYWSGFINGIRDALGAQSKALAVIVPEDVKESFHETFPNIKKGTGGTRETPGLITPLIIRAVKTVATLWGEDSWRAECPPSENFRKYFCKRALLLQRDRVYYTCKLNDNRLGRTL